MRCIIVLRRGKFMRNDYNRDYTIDEIREILSIIKACVSNDNYTVSLNENRLENIDFINTYNLTPAKRKRILLGLEVEDFCYSLNNLKSGFEDEILYIFAPIVTLFEADGAESLVSMYIKFNIIDSSRGDFIIVVSFHGLNYPIDYVFK